MSYVNKETLILEHNKQLKGKAKGVDDITKELYEQDLENNIDKLLSKMKAFSYRPLPVRRVYIPKANGKLRPLGIPAYEDKLVQGAMAKVLNAVYEPKFLNCSYGFRENRNCHMAIREINQLIMTRSVNYILDADIKGFFDNINQEWLMKFLAHDIGDKNFLRYIVRFLKSGIIEDAKFIESDKGTPQGGLISPILANVYLHYALDLWFENKVKPNLKGQAYLIRYADDFIIMFQYENEAKLVYEALKERLKKFSLELEETKTRIIPFGRYKGRKEVFEFLGFLHYNSKTRTGKYTVGHKISPKKKITKKRVIKQWVKDTRTTPTTPMLKMLDIKLTGMFRYYGISGMFLELKKMFTFVKYTVYKWFNRRSQRRSFKMENFSRIWNFKMTKPKVYVDIWNWEGAKV
jgi:group II intron reverse transcriptase/maturase